MRDRKILCLLSSILIVLGIDSLHAETPARVDRHGDPLPEGAIARLGTVRWQLPAPGTAVAFSSDGKKIGVGDSSGHVLLFDSATGKEELTLAGPRRIRQPHSLRSRRPHSGHTDRGQAGTPVGCGDRKTHSRSGRQRRADSERNCLHSERRVGHSRLTRQDGGA